MLAGFLFSSCKNKNTDAENITSDIAEDSAIIRKFSPGELKTNWEKHSIPLDEIKSGGPEKNGIPAIDYPEFVSVTEATHFLREPDFGILLTISDDTRFYPNKILSWHEIVNDTVGNVPVAVTFCPLCGSAIVYERVVDGDTFRFGVSGKLYESNLLMFDHKTESLWSQASGTAVAGDLTDKKLKLVNSVVVSFEEVVNLFPAAKILSVNTGFQRNYKQDPYADYNGNEDLYFPVGNISDRFFNKEMFFVVKAGNSSVAFNWKDLLKKEKANQKTPEGNVSVTVKNFIPSAVQSETGEPLSGYFSYWFSWYATYGDKGLVWSIQK